MGVALRELKWLLGVPAVLAFGLLVCLLACDLRRPAFWPPAIATAEVMRDLEADKRGVLRRTVLDFRFKYTGFTEGWEAEEDARDAQVGAGMLQFETRSAKGGVSRALDVGADTITHLSVAMAVSRGERGEVRWQVAEGNREKDYALSFPLRSGDVVRRYNLTLSGQPGWQGRVKRISIRPSDEPARVAISDVWLTREYLPAADAVMRAEECPWVTLSDETRPGIIAPAPTRLRWEGNVPAGEHLLRIGYGVLPEAWTRCKGGVGFVVSAEEDGQERQLFSSWLRPAQDAADRRWFEAEIDLRPFAGRKVALVFDTLGAPAGGGASVQQGGGFAWGVWSPPRIWARARESKTPNVIILLLDSLRADHLGCYGYSRATSPNIDRLAAQGVRFAEDMSSCSWTSPSVASLLTSLHPHEAAPVQASLDPPVEMPTLAEALEKAGYFTGVVSSHSFIVPSLGFARGTDYFIMTKHDAEACAAGVSTWLERYAREPFFLYVHCFDPHHDYQPPQPFHDKFLDGLQTRNPCVRAGEPKMEALGGEKAWKTLSQEDVAYLEALYDADIAYADAAVGKMLAELGRHGLRDRTLIIVTADHGEEFMEHGGLTHARTLYQELLHVPLIMTFPDGQWHGKVVPQLVRSLDVAPTVLEVAGVPVPRSMHGRSLLPVLRGSETEETAVAELGGMGGPWQTAGRLNIAVRQGNRKVIRDGNGRWALYDLSKDPGEQHNLLKSNDKPPAGAVAVIEQLRAGIAEPVSATRKAMRPEALEAMKALGYLE